MEKKTENLKVAVNKPDRIRALTKGDFSGLLAVYCHKCERIVNKFNWKQHYEDCDFAEKKETRDEKNTL